MENSSHENSSILENVKGDICKATEGLHTATTQPADLREKGTNDQGMKTPYADTLSRQLPTTHTGTLARNHTCNRQILIDKSPDAPANPPNNLDKGKLVEKANEVVTKMSSKSGRPTTDIRVVRAKSSRMVA